MTTMGIDPAPGTPTIGEGDGIGGTDMTHHRHIARFTTRRLGTIALAGAALILAGCSAGSATSPSASAATAPAASSAGDVPSSSAPTGPGAPPPGQPGGATTAEVATGTGAYTLDSGSATEAGLSIAATAADESAVLVSNGASLTLSDPVLSSSGASSSSDASSFYGLDAGVLATTAGSVTITGASVTTSGNGANAAFAYGEGASVTLSGTTLTATGQYAHGAMTSGGGSVTLTDVDISTAGANSAALATDRGGGTITATGGTVTTSGQDSPALYSTGTIAVTGGTYSSSGAEAAVIEGANTITLTDTSLSSSKADKWGALIYQSMSGDASGTKGTFTMTGGSLTYTGANGPLFYVTNSTGVITLKGVTVEAASGILVKAATGSWGTAGANGGTAILTADGQTLTGDLVSDDGSSISATLQNGSTLTGTIDSAALALDASSTWTVTGDSHLTTLSDAAGITGTTITNIVGNGHTVTYDASLATNSALGGATFALAGGGTLTPA